MTEQEKLRGDIDTLKAVIQFDLVALERRPVSADERLVIKNQLHTLILPLVDE
jgi:hypothetical protein